MKALLVPGEDSPFINYKELSFFEVEKLIENSEFLEKKLVFRFKNELILLSSSGEALLINNFLDSNSELDEESEPPIFEKVLSALKSAGIAVQPISEKFILPHHGSDLVSLGTKKEGLFKSKAVETVEISFLNPKSGDIVFLRDPHVEGAFQEVQGQRFSASVQSEQEIQDILESVYFLPDYSKSQASPRFFSVALVNKDGDKNIHLIVIDPTGGKAWDQKNKRVNLAEAFERSDAGALTFNSNGGVWFLPLIFPFIADSFSYFVADKEGNEGKAFLKIIPDAPESEFNLDFEGVTNIKKVKIGGAAVVMQVLQSPESGQILLNPNGGFSYQPENKNFSLENFIIGFTNDDGLRQLITVEIKYHIKKGGFDLDDDEALAALSDNSNKIALAGGNLAVTTGVALAAKTIMNTSQSERPSFFSENAKSIDPAAIDSVVNDNPSQTPSIESQDESTLDNIITEFTGDEDIPIIITIEQLTGDPNVDLNVSIFQQPANGVVTIDQNGNLVFTPNPNYNGEDSFKILVLDELGQSQVIEIFLIVNPVNDAPEATDDTFDGILAVAEDDALNGDVLDNDSDVDGDLLSAILVDGPRNGQLALNADGSFTYTPDENFNGSDSFTYKANDGALDSNIATVNITVNPVNDAPVAVGDAYSVDEDNTLNILSDGVLGNDSDIDLDPLSAVLVDGPDYGILSLNADGSFTYTPDENFNGSDSFTYKANDGNADSNVATVNINVNAVADEPTSHSCSVDLGEGVTIYTIANSKSGGGKKGNTELFSVNLDTKVINSFDLDINDDVEGLTFASDGFLYGVADDDIYKINPTNGNATQLDDDFDDDGSKEFEDIEGLTAIGNTLYAAGRDGRKTNFFEVELDSNNELEADYIGQVSGNINGFVYDPINEIFIGAFKSGSSVKLFEIGNLTDNNNNNTTKTLLLDDNGDPIILPGSIEGLSITSSGEIVAIDRLSGEIILINLSTGNKIVDTIFDVSNFKGDGTESVAASSSSNSFVIDGNNFTLSFSATFGDFTDGSEEHYFLIMIPSADWHSPGGMVVVDPTGLPEGTYVKVDADALIDEQTGEAEGSIVLTASAGLSDPGYENIAFNVYAVAEEVNVPVSDPAGDNLAFQLSTVFVDIAEGSSIIAGDSTNNTLNGTTNADVMIGFAGNDTLSGDDGDDVISGGPGDDILTGGNGNDTFIWEMNDAGTILLPAVDRVTDFNNNVNGDKLDLAGLLRNEENNPLDGYLSFNYDGSDTTINVSPQGDGNVEQVIVLEGVDLTEGGLLNTDIAIIQNLVTDQQIVVDM